MFGDERFSGEKFIVFTEHRDTATFLVRRLEGLGFAGQVTSIHGGLDYRQREVQVELFRRPSEGGRSKLFDCHRCRRRRDQSPVLLAHGEL